MISAKEAREKVNQYYTKIEEGHKKIAIRKLATISTEIEHNARSGLSGLSYHDKTGFFQSQRVEEIVTEELEKLGYKIYANNNHFTIKWD